MKTIRTFSIMFAALFLANVAFATGNLRVDILPLTPERAVVAISNATESKYEISIRNSSGEVVYYNETEGKIADYRKVFDFSKLESGDYKLLVSVDGATSERTFSIDHKNIKVGAMKSNVEPFFSFNDGVLRVAYLNYPGEKANIRIYDKEGLVYNKALGNTFSVNEGLNLSKLETGSYEVVLATGDQNYAYTVEVK